MSWPSRIWTTTESPRLRRRLSPSSGSAEAHARRLLSGSFRAPASPSEIALSPRGGYGDSPLSGSSSFRNSGNGSAMPSLLLPSAVPSVLSSGQRQPPDRAAPFDSGDNTAIGSSLTWLTQMEGLVVTAEQCQQQWPSRPQPQPDSQPDSQPTPPSRPITPRAPGESPDRSVMSSFRRRRSYATGAATDSKQLNTQQGLSMHAALDDAAQLKELLKRTDPRALLTTQTAPHPAPLGGGARSCALRRAAARGGRRCRDRRRRPDSRGRCGCWPRCAGVPDRAGRANRTRRRCTRA